VCDFSVPAQHVAIFAPGTPTAYRRWRTTRPLDRSKVGVRNVRAARTKKKPLARRDKATSLCSRHLPLGRIAMRRIKCGLLSLRFHGLSVCLCVCTFVCWSRPSAVQKRMNRSRCRLKHRCKNVIALFVLVAFFTFLMLKIFLNVFIIKNVNINVTQNTILVIFCIVRYVS